MKLALGILLSLAAALAFYFWRDASDGESSSQHVVVRSGQGAEVKDPVPLPKGAVSSTPAAAPKSNERADFRRTALDLMRLDAKGLREVYRRGEQSASDDERYLAFRAGDFCAPVLLNLHPQVSQEMTGDQWREYERAGRALKARCADFYGMPAKDLSRSVRELVGSLSSTKSDYSPGEYQLGRYDTQKEAIERVRARLKAAIERDGPASLIYVSEGLSTWLELAVTNERYSATIDPAFRENPGTLSISVHLAECMLGFSCDGESMSYLINCASGVGCAGSMEAFLLDSLSEPEQAVVKRQAAAVASAIRAKRLSPLGL